MTHLVPTGDELLHRFELIESRRKYSRTEVIERRLQRLVASPSGFFRGAPALFFALMREHPDLRVLAGRDRRWTVGDVHLENVGVIAIGHGKLVFDFNDLDEAVVGSPIIDVVRGAASAYIAGVDRGMGARTGLSAAEAFIMAYLRPLAEELPAPVKALIARAQERKPIALLDERCPVQQGTRKFAIGKRYLQLDKTEMQVAENIFAQYAKSAPLPWVTKRLRLEDAAFRVQGTGSLGVRRFIYLVREGKRGEQMLIEAKEMRKSAVVRGGLVVAKLLKNGEAGRVKRAMEALLAEAQVGVRAIRGPDAASYLVRLHAPGEDKLLLTSLSGADELIAHAKLVGYRLSQAHLRAADKLPPPLDPGRALAMALDLATAMTRAHLALSIRASMKDGF